MGGGAPSAGVLRPKASAHRLGAEGELVVVVENFSPDPERLVEAALRCAYDASANYYPGVRAATDELYRAQCAPVLGLILRELFGFRENWSFDGSYYSLATTPREELSLAQRIPHIDGVMPGVLAVVHYLRDVPGGTSFYRHRSTGFETIDAARQPRYFASLEADFKTHGEPPPAYIDGDTPIFKRIGGFDAAFNRALIYRSNLFHCATMTAETPLSPDPRMGRLTIASFLSAR